MDQGQADVALRATEVPMLEPEIVRQIRGLAAMSWGSKRIASTLGNLRGAARRYLRGATPGAQERPRARRLDADQRTIAVALLDGEAAGNAVVARQLLGERGIDVALRTLQRAVAPRRQARRAAEVATIRFETAPGHQLQIDFGERRVLVGGREMRVYFFVAVLGYSRRIFVRAFLRERHDDWREGLSGAFLHFGGVTQTVLVDNARALILGRDTESGVVHVHPAFSAFCADWGVARRACRPYRARTKGKTESGVGYVKRNAIAGRSFDSFAALEAHLTTWMIAADTRIHGTVRPRAARRALATGTLQMGIPQPAHAEGTPRPHERRPRKPCMPRGRRLARRTRLRGRRVQDCGRCASEHRVALARECAARRGPTTCQAAPGRR